MNQKQRSSTRRFALAFGVLIVTWMAAGVTLDQSAPITVLGIPFRVQKPELLPIGFVLAALYFALRYYYYAMMLGPTPYRVRRDLLNRLQHRVAEDKTRPVWTYWGASTFEGHTLNKE